MSEVVIVKYVRSPFTPAKKGLLKDIRADELAAQTIRGLLSDIEIKSEEIEDVIIGCANGEGEQGLNVARIISFLAGLPITCGATTGSKVDIDLIHPSWRHYSSEDLTSRVVFFLGTKARKNKLS